MATTGSTGTERTEDYQALRVETNGINVIADAERKGTPRQLFWPWFGANVSVLGLSYGSFGLGFGVSFWQALIAGLLGIVLSFLLCGFIAVAGKRGSAPTMVLSRAPFGVRGNRLPSLLSWLLTVGWETVLTILATLATATVFDRLGWSGGTRHQGDRAGRGGGADHRRRRDGLRPDHADAGGHHRRHRRAHRGLHRAGRSTRSTGTRCRRCPAGSAQHVDRLLRAVPDDRLRAGLGERGRRLLPLPAAAVHAAGA